MTSLPDCTVVGKKRGRTSSLRRSIPVKYWTREEEAFVQPLQAKDDLKRTALPSLLLFLPFLPALLEVGIELSAVRLNIRAVGTRGGMIAPSPLILGDVLTCFRGANYAHQITTH